MAAAQSHDSDKSLEGDRLFVLCVAVRCFFRLLPLLLPELSRHENTCIN